MDQGLKRLVQSHPQDLLTFVLPGAEYLNVLPVEVATEPKLTVDALLRVRYQGTECAVDLEIEARPRPEIGERLFAYGARARVVAKLPVLSVVLWLEPNGKVPSSPFREVVGDRLVVEWHFVGVPLYAVAAETLLAQGLAGLLPLVPFARAGGDVATVERTLERVRELAVGEAEEQELVSLLAVFAARRVGNEQALALVRRFYMSNEILELSPLYRMWVAESETNGIRKGLREGLRLALEGRWGTLPPELEQALAKASTEQMQAAFAHVTSETAEQLTARLSE